jgi:hypothetical protein
VSMLGLSATVTGILKEVSFVGFSFQSAIKAFGIKFGYMVFVLLAVGSIIYSQLRVLHSQTRRPSTICPSILRMYAAAATSFEALLSPANSTVDKAKSFVFESFFSMHPA